jgi:hypothetical protein
MQSQTEVGIACILSGTLVAVPCSLGIVTLKCCGALHQTGVLQANSSDRAQPLAGSQHVHAQCVSAPQIAAHVSA